MIMKMKPTETLSRNTAAVADTLATMIKSELTTYSCSYNAGYLDPSDPNMVTANDRLKLVDWCYDIVDHYQLSRETVASATEMVDRFLSMPSNSSNAARVSDEALSDQSKFQLLTITALYTSIKLNEEAVISSDLFSEMCRRIYSATEIEEMECTLLCGISWRCRAPTAYQVGMSVLSLLLPYVEIPEVTWGFLMDEMKYPTELAVRDYYFSTQRTSTIALAAIFNVIRDAATIESQELLRSFLRVIMECFDFDYPLQLAAARRRLDSLIAQPLSLLDGDNDKDDKSLDGSVKTAAARRRLDSLNKQPLALLDGDNDVDDKSLDDSVKTSKISNRSSHKRKRDLELKGRFCYEIDEFDIAYVVPQTKVFSM